MKLFRAPALLLLWIFIVVDFPIWIIAIALGFVADYLSEYLEDA